MLRLLKKNLLNGNSNWPPICKLVFAVGSPFSLNFLSLMQRQKPSQRVVESLIQYQCEEEIKKNQKLKHKLPFSGFLVLVFSTSRVKTNLMFLLIRLC